MIYDKSVEIIYDQVLLSEEEIFNTLAIRASEVLEKLIEDAPFLAKRHFEDYRNYVSYGFIGNALDSMGLKRKKDELYVPKLRLYVDQQEKLLFEVEDNGQGINKDIEPKIFNEIIDSTKRLDSDCIGDVGDHMYKSRKIVEKTEGTINFFNKGKNKGAIFWYEITLKSRITK